ncbi:MAG: hypothetical protein QOH61_1295, partial [Chloroflexota bacterium]|nr:hypothetical protein [Chloroflexota bacterium]
MVDEGSDWTLEQPLALDGPRRTLALGTTVHGYLVRSGEAGVGASSRGTAVLTFRSPILGIAATPRTL